jgi:hypothetical protein
LLLNLSSDLFPFLFLTSKLGLLRNVLDGVEPPEADETTAPRVEEDLVSGF